LRWGNILYGTSGLRCDNQTVRWALQVCPMALPVSRTTHTGPQSIRRLSGVVVLLLAYHSRARCCTSQCCTLLVVQVTSVVSSK